MTLKPETKCCSWSVRLIANGARNLGGDTYGQDIWEQSEQQIYPRRLDFFEPAFPNVLYMSVFFFFFAWGAGNRLRRRELFLLLVMILRSISIAAVVSTTYDGTLSGRFLSPLSVAIRRGMAAGLVMQVGSTNSGGLWDALHCDWYSATK